MTCPRKILFSSCLIWQQIIISLESRIFGHSPIVHTIPVHHLCHYYIDIPQFSVLYECFLTWCFQPWNLYVVKKAAAQQATKSLHVACNLKKKLQYMNNLYTIIFIHIFILFTGTISWWNTNHLIYLENSGRDLLLAQAVAWLSALAKCSAKTRRSGLGSASSLARRGLSCIREPRHHWSQGWTSGRWFSCLRERTLMTGLLYMWWISLTALTWSMELLVNSAQREPALSCLEALAMSTDGKMETITRSPQNFQPFNIWTCWWIGLNHSSTMRISSLHV